MSLRQVRSSRLLVLHLQRSLSHAPFNRPTFSDTCFTYSLLPWPFLLACGLLVPHQGWNPGPSSESADSWTTRKFPLLFLKNQEEASDVANLESAVYQRCLQGQKKKKKEKNKTKSGAACWFQSGESSFTFLFWQNFRTILSCLFSQIVVRIVWSNGGIAFEFQGPMS